MALALAGACDTTAPAAAGSASAGSEQAMPDDPAFQQAVAAGHSGAEVTFDASLLSAPARVGSHEHLIVAAPGSTRIEVDHNVGLAPWVPAHQGDAVVVRGQLYVDGPGRVGVHCTHAHTSRGCPDAGWIEWQRSYYQ